MESGLRDGLSTALCNTPPEWVLNQEQKTGLPLRQKPWVSLCDDSIFLTAFRREHPERSGVEARNILCSLRNPARIRPGLFSLLLAVAQQYLCMNGMEIRCFHEKMMEWRFLTHQTGQAPYLCALLAWHDFQIGVHRSDFSFSPYAKTDYLRLRTLLSGGMAENHFHLRGSAPAASLNWIYLMNHVPDRVDPDSFGHSKLKQTLAHSYGDNADDPDSSGVKAVTRFYWLVCIAALLRGMLWRAIRGDVSMEDDNQRLLRCLLKSERFSVARYSRKVQQTIDTFRYRTGDSLDYLLPNTGKRHSAFWILSGEQSFLYHVFRCFWENPEAELQYGSWFYAYLLIFFRFRREMVQCNDAYGFDNFQAYQNRKSVFLDKRYQQELVRMAYASALDNPSIKSLEARIVLPAELKKGVQTLTEYADAIPDALDARPNGTAPEKDCRAFFVIHLPKREDKSLHSGDFSDWMTPPCRHQDYRATHVWPLIHSLVDMFRWGYACADRVYGLDACSQEIGCRPEVYAPAFRFARGMAVQMENRLSPRLPRSLHLTYHVGEDFLDITDGLRAIQEAILFLELRAGDRLGHALALGTDPSDWYAKRNNSLFLPKQDVLDNVAWLLWQLKRLNYNDSSLMDWLRNVYDSLCIEIYGESIRPIIYYRAWRLRGDEPSYYLKRETLQLGWRFRISSDPDLCKWRTMPDVVELYTKYHFDANVRKRGDVCFSFQPPQGYAAAVRTVQRDFRKDIARRRLGIETNPSSNLLIGRFGSYERHPILTFNSAFLDSPSGEDELFVSINTDDQGIFDTDLENEFALMACALETEKDPGGSYRYKPEHVLRWIDYVRKMGLEQSFLLGDMAQNSRRPDWEA